jgi:GT2 family glycosyltransferase
MAAEPGRRRGCPSAPAHLTLNARSQAAWWSRAARAAAVVRPRRRAAIHFPAAPRPAGISVVIPSRNGQDLLRAQLPGIARDLTSGASEIIVVDNGSADGTAGWLAAEWPRVSVDVGAAPLSFAHAVNRGIAAARYSHVCLLNNDMLLEPGFFEALSAPFRRVPDLFCATAQIRFPAGVRREETGKAVMAQDRPEDFPIRCDEPLPGEDGTWVLYGSGGCSLYDAAMLQALGNVDEAYEPAYVEDLDLGWRAWQHGWPSVYVAGAVVEHRHRATTSRYFAEEELEHILEVNYLKFLARTVARPALFRRLWRQSLRRLELGAHRPAFRRALRQAWRIAMEGGPRIEPKFEEDRFLALTGGSVALFPGTAEGRVLVASSRKLVPPSPDTLRDYAEVAVIRGPRDGPTFRAAMEMARRKWPGATCEEAELSGEPGSPVRTR